MYTEPDQSAPLLHALAPTRTQSLQRCNKEASCHLRARTQLDIKLQPSLLNRQGAHPRAQATCKALRLGQSVLPSVRLPRARRPCASACTTPPMCGKAPLSVRAHGHAGAPASETNAPREPCSGRSRLGCPAERRRARTLRRNPVAARRGSHRARFPRYPSLCACARIQCMHSDVQEQTDTGMDGQMEWQRNEA